MGETASTFERSREVLLDSLFTVCGGRRLRWERERDEVRRAEAYFLCEFLEWRFGSSVSGDSDGKGCQDVYAEVHCDW